VNNVNKYGMAAIKAVRMLNNEYIGDYPKKVWDIATAELFGEGSSSQNKGCPRSAFLGLCEEGLVKGVPRGQYTRSKKNKEYAIKAVNYLQKNPNIVISPESLWKMIGPEKQHNNQMDVVVGLWDMELIHRL
jgi:hypothetical protein